MTNRDNLQAHAPDVANRIFSCSLDRIDPITGGETFEGQGIPYDDFVDPVAEKPPVRRVQAGLAKTAAAMRINGSEAPLAYAGCFP